MRGIYGSDTRESEVVGISPVRAVAAQHVAQCSVGILGVYTFLG